MNRFKQVFLPSTRHGWWSVSCALLSILLFVVISAVADRSTVVNPNGAETIVNATPPGLPGMLVFYTIFATGIAAFVLGLVSLFKKERGVTVFAAMLFGFVALLVLVGALFERFTP